MIGFCVGVLVGVILVELQIEKILAIGSKICYGSMTKKCQILNMTLFLSPSKLAFALALSDFFYGACASVTKVNQIE